MSHDPVGRQVQELLRPDTINETESIEALRHRVMAQLDSDSPISKAGGSRLRIGSRRGVRRVMAVAAFTTLMLIAGAAIAADRGLLFSNKPTLDRLDILGADAPSDAQIPGASARQYTALDWPIPASSGKPLADDRARVLINHDDGDRSVRLLAVPTTTGNLCYRTVASTRGQPGTTSQSCGRFPSGWPLIEHIRSVNGRADFYYGVMADGIKSVYFLDDNKRQAAHIGHNAYLWIPDDYHTVDAIEVVFDNGMVVRRKLSGAPQDPQIISGGS